MRYSHLVQTDLPTSMPPLPRDRLYASEFHMVRTRPSHLEEIINEQLARQKRQPRPIPKFI